MRELFERFKKEAEKSPWHGTAPGPALRDLSPELMAEIDKRVIPEVVSQGFKAVYNFLEAF